MELDSMFDDMFSVSNLCIQTANIAKEAERIGQGCKLEAVDNQFQIAFQRFQQELVEHFGKGSSSLTAYYDLPGLGLKQCQEFLHDIPLASSKGLNDVICAFHALEHEIGCAERFLWGDQVGCQAFAHERCLAAFSFVADAALQVGAKVFVEDIQQRSNEIIAELRYGVNNPKFPRLLSETILKLEESPRLESFGFQGSLQHHFDLLVLSLEKSRNKNFRESMFNMINAKFQEIYNAAIKRLKETEDAHREMLRQRIEQILAAGEFDKDKFALKEALHGLKAMHGGKDQIYQTVIENVKCRLNQTQSVAEIATLIKAGSYEVLVSRYQCLLEIKSLLKDFFLLDSKTVEAAVQKEVSSLIENASAEIRMHVSSQQYLKFNEIRSFTSVFSTLETVFPNIREIRQKLQAEAKANLEQLIASFTPGAGDAALRLEDPSNIARLLVKGYGVATELNLVDHFRSVIQKDLLKGLSDSDRYMVGHCLTEYCSSVSEGVEEMARTVIDTFPEFKTFNIEIFNKKAGAVSFSNALEELRSNPGAPIRSAPLEAAYERYVAVYTEQVNQIVSDISKYDHNAIKTRIDFLSAQMDAKHLSRTIRELGELLALIASIWTYLAAKGGTRHGLEKKFVKQPHATQILGIFRLLALDHDRLGNHLIQINTGEGKSVALGFTAVVLSKLGYRIDVVCYNRYLSQRDFCEFSELFSELGVSDKINYSDFPTLTSRIMKEECFFPNVRKQFESFLQNAGPKRGLKVKKEQAMQNGKGGPSILLLDEVDVFLSEEFYSRPYRPAFEIEGPESFQILKHVWENRDKYKNCSFSQFCSQLKALRATSALKMKFSNLQDELLEQEFRKMFKCIRCFARQGPPDLRGGEKFYVVDSKTQSIGYEDPVSGVPDYTASYSYFTAFTYFYACSKNELHEDCIRDKIKLRPVCGSYLYSEIPQYYDFTLGMSGTLSCLTKTQHSLLEQYGLTRMTFLPTTFSKKELNALQDPEHSSTVVIRGSYDEYFEKILEDITRELEAGKAILIVFADYSKLRQFSSEIRRRNPRLPQYRAPLELTDSLNDEERKVIIARAVRRYAITLITRPYGRGTDFVCRDEGLRMNGGVHLIITFFPEHESEMKQILGRTCRQDDPGSAQMILFEQDLAIIGASEGKKAKAGFEDWDAYLSRCREDYELASYEAMKKNHEEMTCKHVATLAACKAVTARRWEEAAEHFLELNADRAQVTADGGTGSVDVCFVMDCTGSMSSWIQACKDRVISIALQIRELISSHGQDARVRMAFVGYRDFTKPSLPRSGSNLSYDQPGIEVCQFTEDIEQLKFFVASQRACGGGDCAEDLCGGLEAAEQLAWEAAARYLFLITDAPCHGVKYHGIANAVYDNFPEGDPSGRTPERQLARLMKGAGPDPEAAGLGVRVTFVSINTMTDLMVEVLNKHCEAAAGRKMAVADLSSCSADEQGISEEFGRAVQEEIAQDWMSHHC